MTVEILFLYSGRLLTNKNLDRREALLCFGLYRCRTKTNNILLKFLPEHKDRGLKKRTNILKLHTSLLSVDTILLCLQTNQQRTKRMTFNLFFLSSFWGNKPGYWTEGWMETLRD